MEEFGFLRKYGHAGSDRNSLPIYLAVAARVAKVSQARIPSCVRGTSGGVTTRYIGNYYEWTSAGSTSYYYAGSTRVAQRRVNYGSNNGLFWLTGDHLGSTSVTANSSGTKTAELRYKAWGETRYTSGTTLTTIRYTGQREESSFGLYYYGARWYDSALGRWNQPDTVLPQNQGTQAWDRMVYVNNNPIVYDDPTGQCVDDNCSPMNPPFPASSTDPCVASNRYATGCQSGGSQPPPPSPGPTPTLSFDDLEATAEALPYIIPDNGPYYTNGAGDPERGDYLNTITMIGTQKQYYTSYQQGDSVVQMTLNYQATANLVQYENGTLIRITENYNMSDTSEAPGSWISTSAYQYPNDSDYYYLGAMQGAGTKTNEIWVNSWVSEIAIQILMGPSDKTYKIPGK
jgi:RHS repeat-associated protein